MKLTRLMLSLLLPAAMLTGCSASQEEAVDDSKEEVKVETVKPEETEKETPKIETDQSVGEATETSETFYLRNDLGTTLISVSLEPDGSAEQENVLKKDMENKTTIDYSLEVEEGTLYTLTIEDENNVCEFTGLDLSEIDSEEVMSLSIKNDALVLEYTDKDGKSVEKTGELLSNVQEMEQEINEDEAAYYEPQSTDESQSAPAQDYYEYIPQTPSYDNSGNDYTYVPDSGAYTPSLPSQSQDSCLGEDALIQY